MADAPVGGVSVNRDGIWPFRDAEVLHAREAALIKHREVLDLWITGQLSSAELQKALKDG